MEIDWFSIEIAFSTGITCIPIPAPPSGTIGVTFSSGRRLILSKKRPTSGCASNICWFIFPNSALPGTNIGSTYCFSCFGFSQLYSMTPLTAICCNNSSKCVLSIPVSFTISSNVLGLRTPIFKATSAISSVHIADKPQYSGSYFVIFFIPSFCGTRSVIILASFTIASLSTSFSINSGTKFPNGSAISSSLYMEPVILPAPVKNFLFCFHLFLIFRNLSADPVRPLVKTFSCLR